MIQSFNMWQSLNYNRYIPLKKNSMTIKAYHKNNLNLSILKPKLHYTSCVSLEEIIAMSSVGILGHISNFRDIVAICLSNAIITSLEGFGTFLYTSAFLYTLSKILIRHNYHLLLEKWHCDFVYILNKFWLF